jgi:hypothetical protein
MRSIVLDTDQQPVPDSRGGTISTVVVTECSSNPRPALRGSLAAFDIGAAGSADEDREDSHA